MYIMARKTKVRSYFAVFELAQEGGFNVSFPEFPGCVTFGKDLRQAKQMAREVLELWLEQLEADKEPIPRHSYRPTIKKIEVKLPQPI
jgi:predicted RNase H-like HicB family nuclease